MENQFVYGVSSIDGVTITPIKVNPLTNLVTFSNGAISLQPPLTGAQTMAFIVALG